MSHDDLFQPRYTDDVEGRRVMVGLDASETREFERIDARLPFRGKPVWPGFGDDVPMLPMERRWLELWTRHQDALHAGKAKGARP